VKAIIDERFKLSHRRRFLGKVAFHLQSLEKGDEAGTMMERHELYTILLSDFCKVFDCEDWEAKELVDEFLETIRLRAGLLVEMAPGKFGFSHKTFQEYFAARWIANETILKFNLQIMKDYIDKYIDNAFWHETLLLALRALPEEQALNVLEYILGRDPKGIEQYFYHNHYFVMKFIAEQGQWLGNKEFVEKQIDDFFNFSWNEGKVRSFYENETRQRFQNWISLVGDPLTASIVSEKLLSRVEDKKQDNGYRLDCTAAIGDLGYKNKTVLDRLLKLAKDNKQKCAIRLSIVSSLINLGVKDRIVKILIQLAENKKNGAIVRLNSAKTLMELGKTNTALPIFIQLARSKKDAYILRNCASAIKKMGDKEKALNILMKLIKENNQNTAPYQIGCFDILNLLEENNDVNTLRKLANDERIRIHFRYECAESVGHIGFKGEASELLINLLEQAEPLIYPNFGWAKAFEETGFKDKAREVLSRIIEDNKHDYLSRAQYALLIGELKGKKEAALLLLRMAEDKKQSFYFRRKCATNLGTLDINEQWLVKRLIDLAKNKKFPRSLRLDFAQSAASLGEKEKTVEVLLELLENSINCVYLPFECISALGDLGIKNKSVSERLIQLGKDENQGGYLRRSCAMALRSLGFRGRAVEILFLLGEDKYQNWELRFYCAYELEEMGEKEKAVAILVDLYLSQPDKTTRNAGKIYNSLWELTAG
jgi:HEAT repeat protein